MSPDTGAQTVAQTSGRTLIAHLNEYLARPEVAEQMKPLWAFVGQILETYAAMFQAMFQAVAAITQRAVEACPSTAYEPLLIEHRVNPVPARALASLTISRGTRQANKSRRLPAVVEAIRFLARPG